MSTQDKLRRGLTELQDSGTGSTLDLNPASKLAAIAGLDSSIKALKEFHIKAKRVNSAITKTHLDLGVKQAAEVERITFEHKDLGKYRDEKGRGMMDPLGATTRMKLRNDAVNRMKKLLRKDVAEFVEPLRVEVSDLEAVLKFHRQSWSTPLTYLYRSTAKSSDRATAQAVLANVGAFQLNDAATEAIQTGDMALAAAICTITETLREGQVDLLNFSRETLAATVSYKEYHVAHEAIELAGLELGQADLDARDLAGIKVTRERRMNFGNHKATVLADLGIKPESDSDKKPVISDQAAQNQKYIDEIDRRIGVYGTNDPGPVEQRPGETFTAFMDRKHPGGVPKKD